jgi:mono/diheme cytochrome c family protein
MNESNEPTTQRVVAMALFLVLIVLVWLGLMKAANRNRPHGDDQAAIARGRYLVEEVARCSECHTPRDANGNLNTQAWLEGAPIWIMPVRPIQNWADTTPPLAGLPSFTDAQMFRVLEKGTGPEGEVLRPPMHTYHMSHADAQAIIEYLKSLPVKTH